MTDVSVIIPTYECERYISLAIDSVLAQTFKDYEIIIIDDGSTDNTQNELKKYSMMNNIKIIRQSNQGPSAARNCGIKMSSGKFIAFLDADDIWLPKKLEMQITFLRNNPLVHLVYCNAYIFKENFTWGKTHFNFSHPASGKVLNQLFLLNFIPLLTVVIRRSILNTVGLFDETVIASEDYDLWLRICQTTTIAFINEPLAKYRVSSGQATKQRIKMVENEIKVKEKAFRNAPELLKLSKSCLDQGYYNLLIRIAKLYLQNNLIQESKEYLDKYFLLRGTTLRYLAVRTLLPFPSTIQKVILSFWDRIKIKPDFEKWNS
jgi:glycosyltransferase involved in cell wall biosynthesis